MKREGIKIEQWKDINGFESYYQVSNFGNIRSLDRVITYRNGRTSLHKGKLLSRKQDCQEYRTAILSKNNKIKAFKISRLVALHFISNPCNYLVVNHINGNKKDDREENLEWCTASYNNVHAFNTGLKKRKHKTPGLFFDKKRKRYCAYIYRDNKNIFIGRFETKKEAKNRLNERKKEYSY